MTQNPNRSAYRVIFDGSLGEHFWITVLCFAFIFRTWDQYKYIYIYIYLHTCIVCVCPSRSKNELEYNIVILLQRDT